jgi:hypothetical protein
MMMSELIERLKTYIPKGDGYNDQFAHDLAEAVEALQSQWVSVQNLPKLGEPVVLININEWESTGGDLIRNVQDCGYLSEFGAKYWSIRGQGAKSIDAYTHYRLVKPPAKEQAQ